MPNTSNNNLLHNIYLFKDLTPKELEQVTAIAKQSSFNHGDEVFAEGDDATSLYVVKFGSVKIKHSMRDERIDLAIMASGAHFGEMAFFDGEKRSATVVVNEKTDLVSITFKDLRQLLESNPQIAIKVYKAMAFFLCGRLRVTTNDLTYAREKNLRHF
jgi:CRP/FNR family transcriptional regulator, cyclic AMP receptor protein